MRRWHERDVASVFGGAALILTIAALLIVTRCVLHPAGFAALVMLPIAYFGLASFVLLRTRQARRTRAFGLTGILLAILLAAVGTRYKASLMGIDVFHVPSESMAPVLRKGDLLVADTWHYRKERPAAGEIAVFFSFDRRRTYVKRVASVSGTKFDPVGDGVSDLANRVLANMPVENLRARAAFVLVNVRGLDGRSFMRLSSRNPPARSETP